MLAVSLKAVLGMALARSTYEMLKLEISEGLKVSEGGAYHGTIIKF